MILNNNIQNNRALNIEGNRISNLIKNNINDISSNKINERSIKIKELTKLYRVQKGFILLIFFHFNYLKGQYKKERQFVSRNISLPSNIMPDLKQMS